jgi:hypothetical protein
LPIILDESLVHSSDLAEFIKLDMLDGIAMKIPRSAGLTDACRQIEMALEHGLMFLGSGLTDPTCRWPLPCCCTGLTTCSIRPR